LAPVLLRFAAGSPPKEEEKRIGPKFRSSAGPSSARLLLGRAGDYLAREKERRKKADKRLSKSCSMIFLFQKKGQPRFRLQTAWRGSDSRLQKKERLKRTRSVSLRDGTDKRIVGPTQKLKGIINRPTKGTKTLMGDGTSSTMGQKKRFEAGCSGVAPRGG